MRILVTGASGFIGSHVVTALLERGHEVIAGSRDPERARVAAGQARVTWLRANVSERDPGLFERAGRPDVLIHAAWERLDNYRDPVHFEKGLMEHYGFLRDLVSAGLPQCLVLGSCLEYGLREGALREDFDAKPVLAYPLAKHLLRQMLEGLQATQAFRLQWARLFYLHGPGQRASSLLAQLDAALAAGQEHFDMSPGDQLRDYLPVQEAAGLICAIAEHREFDGIINCCSGRPISVLELVRQRVRERGATINLNTGRYPYPDYEPHAFWGDRSRLDKLLNEAKASGNTASGPVSNTHRAPQ